MTIRHAACLALCLVLGSCGETDRSDDQSREGRALFQNQDQEGVWRIVVASVRGTDRRVETDRVQRKLASVGIRDTRVVEEGDVSLVCLGAYPSPDDPQAQRDLQRVKDTTVDGARPFLLAHLAPPLHQGQVQTALPQYDLKRARENYGGDPIYTLEIAIYGRTDGTEPSADDLAIFRQAAEEAVLQLRREGQEAFFHHGRRTSSVTIGLYDEDDHDPTNPMRDSMRLGQAREKHPHKALNGMVQEQLVHTEGGSGRRRVPVRSTLVAIPR